MSGGKGDLRDLIVDAKPRESILTPAGTRGA